MGAVEEPTPIHVFTASILGGLNTLGVLNQGVMNLLVRSMAPKLIGYMIRRGLLPSTRQGGDPAGLIAGLLNAINVGVYVVEGRGDTLVVTVKKCYYCPKRVGGAKLQGTACPIPRLLVELLRYYGYTVTGHPKPIITAEGCKTKIMLGH